MQLSPLEFAKAFEKFTASYKSEQSEIAKLLIVIDYYEKISEKSKDKQYKGYVDQYKSILSKLSNAESIANLFTSELEKLNKIADYLDLPIMKDQVSSQLLKQYCNLAEWQKALYLIKCEKEPELPDNMSELDQLSLICSQIEESHPDSFRKLNKVYQDWKSLDETIEIDSVNSLFTQYSTSAGNNRGRILSLTAKTSTFGKKNGKFEDEITFANQLIDFNDSFLGSLNKSLEVVREYYLQQNRKSDFVKKNWRVRYSVENSSDTFTGDSIGLSAAVLIYIQLQHQLVSRRERFIYNLSSFTGAIDENGNLIAVNEKSLEQKIGRAFYSPIKYLVLPESNRKNGNNILANLQSKHKNRRLRLIGAEQISEIFENRNIVREQKVCLGEYAAKSAYKFTRTTRIQVPLLLILIYTFVCILYPKAWIGFDWNPNEIVVTGSGFQVLNDNDQYLWEKRFDCNTVHKLSAWEIGNLDDDDLNEVAFSPKLTGKDKCDINGRIYVYDNDGTSIFDTNCTIYNQYPGDSAYEMTYNISHIEFVNVNSEYLIITSANRCYPARTHIRYFSAVGDSLGWYVAQGTVGAFSRLFSNSFEAGFVFAGINNRINSACLLILPRDSLYGVSPPYESPDLDLTKVVRGNQLSYISFPQTDLSKFLGKKYNGTIKLRVETTESIRLVTNEAGPTEDNCGIDYYISENLEVWKALPNDTFIQTRDSITNEGKLPPMDWNEFSIELLNSVLYWSDSGFQRHLALSDTIK